MKMSVFLNSEFINAFNRLLDQQLPIKTAHKLQSMLKDLIKKEEFFRETRDRILFHASNHNHSLLEQELWELSDTEFEIGKIDIDALEGVEMSAKEIALLSELFK